MRRHVPFLWIMIFFVAGILIHSYWQGHEGVIGMAGAFVLGGAYVYRRNRIVFVVLVLLEFVLLGWVCSHSRWIFSDDHIYFWREKMDFTQIVLRGKVAGDVRHSQMGYSKGMSFILDLYAGENNNQWHRISGKVLVNVFRDFPLDYGDEIVLTGKLHRPFEFSHDRKFSYCEYLKRQGIYYVLSVKKDREIEILCAHQGNLFLTKLYQWRGTASRLFLKYLDPLESSLMQAMILGQRLNISAAIKDIFMKTGTAHILAISGFNVGIVVMVVFLLLRMVPGPRVMIYMLTIIFVAFYVLLTGASPSVVRAGIMSGVFLASFIIEREIDSINSLSFAAFLLLLFDPQNIFDIGFQLSFISVLGILLFYPLLMARLKPFLKKYPFKVLKFIMESFAVSLAATAAVAGLIAYYFNIVTPVSLFANLLVVPLSTLAAILGIGMLLSGGIALYFAVCIEFVLNLMVWVMMSCQKIPWAYYYLKDVNIWDVISYYCLLISLWLWIKESHLPLIDKERQL